MTVRDNKNQGKKEPGLGKTFLEDFQRGDFSRTLKRDWRELKNFYINEERRSKLENMNRIKGFFYMLWWLLKSLFLKLSPARRMLLLLSFFLLFLSSNNSANGSGQGIGFIYLAGILILFILMLELKDKLVAKTELAVGRQVQMALMPEEVPSIENYSAWLYTKPANDVGGDLVDYIKLENGNHAFVLGDVAGKGLGAALLMAKLQSTIRAYISDYDSLDKLGEKINSIFYRDILPQSFASMIYLELNPISNHLKLLNCGHLRPIIVRADGLEEFEKGGLALGLVQKASYKEQTFEFQPNDILFIYSDGVIEASNEYGQFFGEERLKKTLPKMQRLSSQSFGTRLIADIEYFIGDAPAHDDLSLLVIKRISSGS